MCSFLESRWQPELLQHGGIEWVLNRARGQLKTGKILVKQDVHVLAATVGCHTARSLEHPKQGPDPLVVLLHGRVGGCTRGERYPRQS